MIETNTNIKLATARALEPFNESLEVEPYRMHLDHAGVRAIAEHYQVPPTDLESVAAKLPDWMGYPGGVDELGVFASVNRNPDAKWDWYEIGGRWDGYITGHSHRRRSVSPVEPRRNVILAAELLASPDFPKRLPHAVLAPTGEWAEQATFVATTAGWYWRETPDKAWRERVRRILAAFPGHRVVCVDVHI